MKAADHKGRKTRPRPEGLPAATDGPEWLSKGPGVLRLETFAGSALSFHVQALHLLVEALVVV
ncbi:MAG: hypothetical protein JRE71_17440 [Deltaproteobacteria bacterium]|nr:hypothetical protein [Deltaproteobacteria bacterium]